MNGRYPQDVATGAANSGRLRLFVTVAIIGVLVWFLLDALEREVGKVEERAANMVLSQLRTALVIRGAEVMLSRGSSLDSQEGINPFKLVEHQWANYQGTCRLPQPAPGNWCFYVREQKETINSPRGSLIYTSSSTIKIQEIQVEPDKPLAWKVTTEFADRNNNGQREQDERPTGLKLSPVSLTDEVARTQDADR
jgi:hypothetical protein